METWNDNASTNFLGARSFPHTCALIIYYNGNRTQVALNHYKIASAASFKDNVYDRRKFEFEIGTLFEEMFMRSREKY